MEKMFCFMLFYIMISHPNSGFNLFMFEYLVAGWWNCLGGITRKGLDGGGISQFEVSKPLPFPVNSLSHSCVSRHKL